MNIFKRNNKFSTLFFLLILFVAISLHGEPLESEQAAGQEEPVHVTVENNSSHTVQVHIISHGMISGTYTLGSKQNLELDVDYGHSIRLEYPPCPRRTTLSQMGSLNEKNRMVYLRDDGENLFIQEKFSGARKETRNRKGQRRIPRDVISEPETDCADKQGSKVSATRKEDPNKPAPKVNKEKTKTKKNKKKGKEKK